MGKLEQKKKLNNGGFSLVELIIVIAIMVVLVGVLAPTYLRYVEKSRVSADASTLDEYYSVMQALASDVDATLNAAAPNNSETGTGYTVTYVSSSKSITVSSDLKTALQNLGLMTSDDLADKKVQSAEYQGKNVRISLYYDDSAKVWKVQKNF